MNLISAETLDARGLTSINSREVVIGNYIETPVSDLVKECVFRTTSLLMKTINRRYREIAYSFFTDIIKLQIVSNEAHSTIREAST
jgi:hypothetical protein